MEKIIINLDNLKDEEITKVVKIVKILILNFKKEILLAYSHNEYQFPGGHVEDNELHIDAVNREITEETGMVLNIKNIKPFACLFGYYKDYSIKQKHKKNEIYYYEFKTNEKPNLKNTCYTEHEKCGNFELRYISIDVIEQVLKQNAQIYEDKHGITNEMLKVLKIYKNK